MTQTTEPVAGATSGSNPGRAPRSTGGRAGGAWAAASGGSTAALLIKVVLLAILDAATVYAALTFVQQGNWFAAIVVVAVVVLINVIYLKRGWLPAKYLTPGLIFLAIFQIFVVLYTVFIAFTNYGDQNNSDKADAVEQIILTSQVRVPDSPSYPTQVYRQGDQFGFLVQDPDGETLFGTTEQPLEEADGAPDGWEQLDLSQIVANTEAVQAVAVPLSDDPNDGTLKTPDGSTSYVFESSFVYDEQADTFTNAETGEVYSDRGDGFFQNEDGDTLTPGWRVFIGFENFAQAFTNDELRDPLLRVILWTFAFAFLSVFTTFALGLFLAIVFQHPNLRGKKIYRILVILPYAFPAFLTGLVWAGMLNEEFGFFNQVLFGGAQIPWLADPWLARFSLVVVNLWLGFPYMFLVCTGALQSLPDDIIEAAKVDGASAWRIFSSVKLPLLFVAVAPLLIASFAFNFNNFNIPFMLTRGGPRFSDTTLDIGATDLLITLVYKVAFGGGGGRDYGLASALAILILIIVAIVSIIGFRRTHALEELN